MDTIPYKYGMGLLSPWFHIHSGSARAGEAAASATARRPTRTRQTKLLAERAALGLGRSSKKSEGVSAESSQNVEP
jgi:hypothetical protein